MKKIYEGKGLVARVFWWLLNYVCFYVIWVLDLRGASSLQAFVPLLVFGMYFLIHMTIVTKNFFRESLLVVFVTMLGLFNESLLAYFNIVSYEDAFFLGVAWWTISLYATFATTLWYSFAWLTKDLYFASLLSAMIMPFCYHAMAHIGALSLPDSSWRSIVIIGIQYALLIPVCCMVARTLLPKQEKLS
jgi:hypothetical protein